MRRENRLARETSPYLLQHAHNPVDWYPWGTEAIERARREGKLLFVSIGYATCYWCHVMERESFEDQATARILNEHFVPVKVDREQRPDIDDVYMTACQVYTEWTEGRASGGWPLSIFVEPQGLRPVFVGTYFPPQASFGRPSFSDLMEVISEVWTRRRDEALRQAERLAEAVTATLSRTPAAVTLDGDMAQRAARALLTYHDRLNGGFGGAPKFPQPSYIELLMHVAWDEPDVAACIARTLDAMASGGIFDQVGGGFHRYAVDSVWGVPHFEKMLYDNAQLAAIFARSAARHHDAYHAEIARRIADYVLREMVDVDGTFYSAQDAEVDAREGKSYVWRREEVREALIEAGLGEHASTATAMYGLDRGSNFQDPHHPNEPPSNVLVLSGRPERVAAERSMDLATFATVRQAIDRALLTARARRRQPSTDDKVLTAWNGLMIAALAEVGRRLNEPRTIDAARRAADAVDRRLRSSDGTLLRSARGAVASIPGFLEDYAFLLRGRIALAECDPDHAAAHLTRAEALFEEAERLFAAPGGGYFDARERANELFVRSRGIVDGAVPSGNGVMLENGLALLRLTGRGRYREALRRHFAGLSGMIAEQPIGTALSTAALWRASKEAPDVLPSGDADDGLVAMQVTRGEASGEYRLAFTIADGFHIQANEPGDPALIGLHLELRGPGRLIVDYPSGEPYGQGLRVHRGTVRVTFRVEGATVATRLAVRSQPCDERACRRPRTLVVELPK
jgi:uncharacterized protein YyaL (SSP411 family)